MITIHEVENIKKQLQKLANGSIELGAGQNYPATWGFDNLADPIPGSTGLFVVLYNNGNSFVNNIDGAKKADVGTSDKRTILAISTRIPAGLITREEKTITISNVPYTETISTVTSSPEWQDNENNNAYAKATAFAIVMGNIGTAVDILNEQGAPVPKYVLSLEGEESPKVLFEGNIGNGQTIEPNNSFALTNIRITFS